MRVYRLTLVWVLLLGLVGLLGLFGWGWFVRGLEIPNVLFSAVLGALGTLIGAIIRNNGTPPSAGTA